MATNQNEYNQALQNLILMNRKKIEIEKLWENASPTSAFGAQEITIANITTYDEIIIVDTKGRVIVRPTNGVLKGSYYAGESVYGVCRAFDIGTNKLVIGQGEIISSSTIGWQADNTAIIPYRVYARKRVN